MNGKRVICGTAVWTVGLSVPMLYHAALIHAAVRGAGYSYSYRNMVSCFFDLPWIVWPYILAMTGVGAALVISGFRKQGD